MPIHGAKYRVTTTKSGKKIRLAFVKNSGENEVVEAKNMKTGKIHTQAEFKADKKRKAQRGKGK